MEYIFIICLLNLINVDIFSIRLIILTPCWLLPKITCLVLWNRGSMYNPRCASSSTPTGNVAEEERGASQDFFTDSQGRGGAVETRGEKRSLPKNGLTAMNNQNAWYSYLRRCCAAYLKSNCGRKSVHYLYPIFFVLASFSNSNTIMQPTNITSGQMFF